MRSSIISAVPPLSSPAWGVNPRDDLGVIVTPTPNLDQHAHDIVALLLGAWWAAVCVAACGFIVIGFCHHTTYAPWQTRLYHARATITLALSRATLTHYELTAVGMLLVPSMIFLCCLAAYEEELFDAAALGVLVVVVIVIACVVLSVGSAVAYSLTPVSGGESLRRLGFADLMNFVLCVVRIFLCWIRYLFYDTQVEWSDMVLGHTDEVSGVGGDGALATFPWLLLPVVWVVFDGVVMFLLLGLSVVKLGLALFLLWLIIDLFLLRSVGRVHSAWLVALER